MFESGLYVVATPIGNLADMSQRAIDLLEAAEIVAVEDSRVTGKLLHHLGLKKKMRRYNDHSGATERDSLVAAARGAVVALVSDAGTPLISDPGYKLVRSAREAGVPVFTIPGASAVTAALSICGLPTDRFLFAGFLPNKAKARVETLLELGHVKATLVFYEAGPRLAALLRAGRGPTVGLGRTKRLPGALERLAPSLGGQPSLKTARGAQAFVAAGHASVFPSPFTPWVIFPRA